ncbi:MAG: hypothetical protein HS132_07070 [Planctomycetia bacterium]|nr:hypothetical protein [Planctomycetia bacterium]
MTRLPTSMQRILRDGGIYKKLRARLTGEFTNPKWIVQPTALYSESGNDEWIYQIKDRADKDELTPDLLSQEVG